MLGMISYFTDLLSSNPRITFIQFIINKINKTSVMYKYKNTLLCFELNYSEQIVIKKLIIILLYINYFYLILEILVFKK